MINSFQSMNTITSGLILQELEQQVTANNLAQPYLDSQGYLMNSLVQVNPVDTAPFSFSGANGLVSVGTGVSVASLTRLRNSFLDNQIQQESSVLGLDEVLANTSGGPSSTLGTGVLNQINTIVADPASNLSTALTAFQKAWATLGADANPATNTADRLAVVNAGVAFAQMSNSQYEQLQNLQINMNGQVQQTVGSINELLQQLSAINQQLNTTQGSNQNTLLDARDYALDRLSRLMNMQATFGSNGTVSVWLNGVALVNSQGAATLQTNINNVHNPQLLSVTVLAPNGSPYGSENSAGALSGRDVTSLITGGNLAGELQANNVILESYKDQVDQIATSVLNITNILHTAGYAADGTTTGVAFFNGTGAADISVNAVLSTDVTAADLAAAIQPGTPTNGQIAQFLGNLSNLLANNYVQSQPSIAAGYIDPTQPISSQPLGLPPSPGGGQFTIDGNVVNWDPTQSIDTIIANINAADPNVNAVYNATNEQFYILSNSPVVVVNVSGNFFGGLASWGHLTNVLASTIRMNNGFATTDPNIDIRALDTPAQLALNSNLLGTIFHTGPNDQAFRVTPSTSGTFTIFGVPASPPTGIQIAWTNTMSLPQILASISAATGGVVTATFNSKTQTLALLDHSPLPIQIVDNSGNFTVFTGLNGNLPIGDLATGLLGNISTNLSAAQLSQTVAANSLNQLNTEQANVAAVGNPGNGSTPGTAGVPIATIQQQALQSLIQYNASLQVLQVIDQMFEDLVGILGTSSSSGVFQQKGL